tara:strand:- start:2586 stop:3671 length:1086 start_codon:yes stop_codon:yes gene_type:complete
MALISKTGIASGSVIYPEQVLRSIEALRGEVGHDFVISGSLIISASTVQIKTLLQNNQISAIIGYNTSSGDLYFTTGSYTGPAGPSGSFGPPGASGSSGPSGSVGNGIDEIVNNGNGTLTFVFTDSTSYTTPSLIGPSGSSGPQGPAGTAVLNGLDIPNQQIRYVAYTGPSNDRVEILSSANIFTRKVWSRSSTTLTIAAETHGLSSGDYVVIMNASTNYIYAPITVIDVNNLSITVPNSGSASGALASYIPAFRVSNFTQGGVTVISPSTGNAQINSLNIITGTKSSSTFTAIMPLSITNGAGSNNNLYNMNPPIMQAYRLSNGTQITTTSITLNTVSNFNQFRIEGLVSLVNNQIRLTF